MKKVLKIISGMLLILIAIVAFLSILASLPNMILNVKKDAEIGFKIGYLGANFIFLIISIASLIYGIRLLRSRKKNVYGVLDEDV